MPSPVTEWNPTDKYSSVWEPGKVVPDTPSPPESENNQDAEQEDASNPV